MASVFRNATSKTKELFINLVNESRITEGASIVDFQFLKARCRVLSKMQEIGEGSNGILYWMWRDCRVQDNWAMLFAQRLALKNNLPLFVCFFLQENEWLYPTRRHLKFLLDGLKSVREECQQLKIPFYLLNTNSLELVNIIRTTNIGCIVSDFSPLRQMREVKEALLQRLPSNVALVEVDAHNIVPVWEVSGKQELAARTIRPKINKKLPEFLTGFPAICEHPYKGKIKLDFVVNDYNVDSQVFKGIQFKQAVPEVNWAEAGPTAALETLYEFICNKLKFYGQLSNDPSKEFVSNLSPWLHFGQIAAQRVALEVETFKTKHKDQSEKFLEELIVRKELSDNYCYYNENYDNFNGADFWAKKTLTEHKKDKRQYVYSLEQLENAKTHDEIWNCAQMQLNEEGKMHGYMRMYWCKKILEWTESPEEAIRFALYLNDTYSLDGNDPNGYVGVMWSICGVHDHGWKEREIFGKIRYMVDYSLRKKFDIDAYCMKYLKKTKPKEESNGEKASKRPKTK